MKYLRFTVCSDMYGVVCKYLATSMYVVCTCQCMFLITQEWRHAHGMRCLGIPNTAHFANVTNIADAIACK